MQLCPALTCQRCDSSLEECTGQLEPYTVKGVEPLFPRGGGQDPCSSETCKEVDPRGNLCNVSAKESDVTLEEGRGRQRRAGFILHQRTSVVAVVHAAFPVHETEVVMVRTRAIIPSTPGQMLPVPVSFPSLSTFLHTQISQIPIMSTRIWPQ